VTVNSDDPGIFNTSLCHDYALLEDCYGFNEEHFKKLNEIAFEASFIPLGERLKVRPEFNF
jgi:adenosine deaminase